MITPISPNISTLLKTKNYKKYPSLNLYLGILTKSKQVHETISEKNKQVGLQVNTNQFN